MKLCLITSVNKLRHFSQFLEKLKGGFHGLLHAQATTLIIQFDCFLKQSESMQMTFSGNLPFHGQSRKHDHIDKISQSNSFRVFKLHAESTFLFSYQQDVFRKSQTQIIW